MRLEGDRSPRAPVWGCRRYTRGLGSEGGEGGDLDLGQRGLLAEVLLLVDRLEGRIPAVIGTGVVGRGVNGVGRLRASVVVVVEVG
jgi:hypothetical protein